MDSCLSQTPLAVCFLQADRQKAEASAAAERARQDAADAAERARQDAADATERTAAMAAAAAARFQADLGAKRARLPEELPTGEPGAVNVMVRLPGGGRASRRCGSHCCPSGSCKLKVGYGKVG